MRIRTTTVHGIVPGFSCPSRSMESYPGRVESNGSRSAPVDMVVRVGIDEGDENYSTAQEGFWHLLGVMTRCER